MRHVKDYARHVVKHLNWRAQHNADFDPTADCCVRCGLLIDSTRQVTRPGCQYCADCEADLLARLRRAGM